MMNMLRRLEEGSGGDGDHTNPEAGGEEEEFLLKLEGLDIST